MCHAACFSLKPNFFPNLWCFQPPPTPSPRNPRRHAQGPAMLRSFQGAFEDVSPFQVFLVQHRPGAWHWQLLTLPGLGIKRFPCRSSRKCYWVGPKGIIIFRYICLIQRWRGKTQLHLKKLSMFQINPSVLRSSLRVHMWKIQCGLFLHVFVLFSLQSTHVKFPGFCIASILLDLLSKTKSNNQTPTRCRTFVVINPPNHAGIVGIVQRCV